jgi:hypothetical protein
MLVFNTCCVADINIPDLRANLHFLCSRIFCDLIVDSLKNNKYSHLENQNHRFALNFS